jgi:pimeloyl-ACP methyl ester carboxylesterase
MEQIETTLGPVPVWGGPFDSDRPLVLGIRGAFPPRDLMADLDPPGADLALVHLPGFFSPVIRPMSIETFARAFDEMIERRFPGRRITLVGMSTGAVAALAMRAPQIEAVLAVEPFFCTAKLWPLIAFVQDGLKTRANPVTREWCEGIFGYFENGVVDRDYRHLAADPARPTLMMAGETALWPVRTIEQLPSLADEADRALLPHKVVPGGHNVPMADIRAGLAELQTLKVGAPVVA